MCDGDGSNCTAVVNTKPKAIGSGHPSVLVIGAGFDDGDETVCQLHDPGSGDVVVNTTGEHVRSPMI